MVLTWLDYAVIAGYLVAITQFGSYFARFQKTTRDYFLTGKSVPWWAICFTVVATETSTLTFISVPATAYTGDMTFLQLVFGYVIGRVIISLIFIPAYFRGDLFTSYELLQRRFGDRVKNVAAVIFLITRSLADGIRLFATALVISVVTQVPVTVAVIVIGAAMIVYTVRGGSAAVIWTDVVQLFVYIAGAAVVFVSFLALIPGGWSEVVRVGTAAGKFRVFDLSWTLARPYTLWAGIIGGVALTLATHGTDQFLVQRLLSARSAREAARGLVLSGFLVFAQFVLFLIIGVMLFTYYQHVPLPRRADARRRIAPRFHRDRIVARRRRLHCRGDRGSRALAVNQCHGRDDGERLLCEVRQAGCRRSDVDAGVADVDDRLGHRADRRGHCRAMDAAIGARRGPCRAVVGVRTCPWRVSAWDAGTGHHRAAGVRRHDCRSRRDDDRLGMASADRLQLVRVHRRGDDRERRAFDADC